MLARNQLYCLSSTFHRVDEEEKPATIHENYGDILDRIVSLAKKTSPESPSEDILSIGSKGDVASLSVHRYPRTTGIIGGIAGPVCFASIRIKKNLTGLLFVLAEKNHAGHDSKDLRLPLF